MTGQQNYTVYWGYVPPVYGESTGRGEPRTWRYCSGVLGVLCALGAADVAKALMERSPYPANHEELWIEDQAGRRVHVDVNDQGYLCLSRTNAADLRLAS